MLQISDLTKRYGAVRALDGATFTARRGRLVGFLGPNGAGKTTTMRCIFGLATADSGTVSWDGRPIDAAARLRFGYMPEQRGLYPRMRVGEQLSYFGQHHGLSRTTSRTKAGVWLERFGLEDRAKSKLEDLSHGNQQRVQLATALVHAPELLVLDEPFSGLDPVGVDVLTGVLREQVASGVPVVFSSHQLELVERICDSVVLIAHGRIVASGPIEELRSRGDRRLVRVELTDASPGWEEMVAGARVLERLASGAVFELDAGTPPNAVL